MIRDRGGGPGWRAVEWWGAVVAVFIQTGAVTRLLTDAHSLNPTVPRLLFVLSYGIVAVLLLRCRGQIRIALSRSLPFVILLALPYVSALWSISGSITLRRAIGLTASVALAYALAIRFTPRQLAKLVAGVLGACMALSLVFAVALPQLGWMPGGDGLRGVFTHKNILGWYAAISALACAALASGEAGRVRRLAVAGLAASLICLAASGSMTGILSMAAAVVLAGFYAVLLRLRGPGRMLFVIVALQLAVLAGVATAELLGAALEALGKDATLTGRTPLWRLVDAQIGRHLLLGFGYQAFWTEANPEAWKIWSKLAWMAPHAHSGYRDVLLNFGLVGFPIFALAILRGLLQGAALSARAPQDGWLWLNVIVGMFLVMNLTESLFLMQNEFLFVLFATALFMFGLRRPEARRAPPSDDRKTGASGRSPA